MPLVTMNFSYPTTGQVLFQYLDTQSAVNRAEGSYWAFHRRDVTLIDPYAIDRNDHAGPGEAPARITVYVPSGNSYRLDLATAAGVRDTLQLWRYPPDKEVVRLAKGVLT